MNDWPVTLPQQPNLEGFSQIQKPNVVRSGMGYGPDKVRRRVTMDLYSVGMVLWLTQAQMETLDQFYVDNIALAWNWVNFKKSPPVAAVYTFMAPPAASPMGNDYWAVNLSLEMEGG